LDLEAAQRSAAGRNLALTVVEGVVVPAEDHGGAVEQPHDRVGVFEIRRIVQRRDRHRDDVARNQGGDSQEVDVASDERQLAAVGGDGSRLVERDGGRCDGVVGGLMVSEARTGRCGEHQRQQGHEKQATHR
jgi:hypothetical protein